MESKFYSESILLIISLLLLTFKQTHSWNLKPLNITAFDIVHVSVYCNRAFLSIESRDAHKKIPSLVEASWPENIIGHKPKVFSEDFAIRFLRPGLVCDEIVKARATDVDRKGNLWILDDGGFHYGAQCSPKLSVHSLVLLNERLHVHEFPEFRGFHFSYLILDSVINEDLDIRAYFTFHNSPFLVIYSLREKKYAKVKFESNEIFFNQNPYLSEAVISQNGQMYLLDTNSGHLFSVHITALRYCPIRSMELELYSTGYRRENIVTIRMPMMYVGRLLGNARGLAIHPHGKICYILPRDGAIVAWNPKLPLVAEYHDVLYQYSGNISQIVFGWRGSVWIVHEGNQHYNHCTRIRA